MPSLPSYVVHRVGKPTRRGITEPTVGSMRAILKQDGPEVPTCVYNELVATRLARLVFAPLAEGVLAYAPHQRKFASLLLALPEARLPDLSPRRLALAANAYPEEAAGLTVFDLWVGNRDRASNLKAALVSPVHRLFCGFDHSHCLLAVEGDSDHSIARLGAKELIVEHHPFYGLIQGRLLDEWVSRVSQLPEALLRAACGLGEALNDVSERTQQALAAAMVNRTRGLPAIVRAARARLVQP